MMNAAQILEKRGAVEAKLAALREAQGAAIVDGKAFAGKEIGALEAELDGIAAAEGELARHLLIGLAA